MSEPAGEAKEGLDHVRRQYQLHAALVDASIAITSTLDLRTILAFLLEKVELVLPTHCATTVSLFNKETGTLEPMTCRNVNEKEWKAGYKAANRKPGRSLIREPLPNGLPMITGVAQRDLSLEKADIFLKHGFSSYLEVPLIAKGEPLGVLGFYTERRHQFGKEEVEFVSMLATEAAIAIQKSQLYEQTRKQAVELERANKIKSEFLSLISHELRTPLTAIMGYTGVVRDGILGEIDERQKEALGKALDRSNNLLGMIESILQATLFETEEVKVESAAVNLSDFLSELTMLYRTPLDKELTLVWDYPPTLPTITTDRAKLRHILGHLINNAIKFTERGSVTVSVRLFPKAKTVKFQIRDTGIGIPREALPGIFDIFRQVDSSEKRAYGGMGVGLYIVKKFVEILRGTIAVKSRPGKGSIFTVTLSCQN